MKLGETSHRRVLVAAHFLLYEHQLQWPHGLDTTATLSEWFFAGTSIQSECDGSNTDSQVSVRIFVEDQDKSGQSTVRVELQGKRKLQDQVYRQQTIQQSTTNYMEHVLEDVKCESTSTSHSQHSQLSESQVYQHGMGQMQLYVPGELHG